MKVGIIGSGGVGQSLASGFAATGAEVKIGTRDPANAKLAEWSKRIGAKGSVGRVEEAASFGDVLVVATQWSGTENALRLAGAERCRGKVVIDVTNPLGGAAGQPPSLVVGFSDSGGESVQRWLPGARVVKAFNTVGHPLMYRPDVAGGPPDMFFCGDDAAAKKTVADILVSFAWNPIDIGDLRQSRLLEPLAMLWITHAFRSGEWMQAFKLLKKT